MRQYVCDIKKVYVTCEMLYVTQIETKIAGKFICDIRDALCDISRRRYVILSCQSISRHDGTTKLKKVFDQMYCYASVTQHILM